MQTTAPDCEALRRRRGELEDRLDELRAERGLAGELRDAGSALGRLAGALRSLAAGTGGAAAAADRLLATARLAAAALADLLGGARSGLVDAPETIARVQGAVEAVSAAVERIERAFAVAEGSTAERLAATRGFVADLSAALEGLDAVPGLRAFLDDTARALEVMATWAERAAALRRRRDGGPAELPGIGPSLWPAGEREEPAAEEEALELRLARLDHDLLACGDRPGGPACIGCGDEAVDRFVGDALGDAGSLAKDKAADLAGSAADLAACRTALRRRRDLDQQILETRWELQEAVRRRHTRKAADIRARLERLLVERRGMQRLMPAHVARYRRAAAAYRQAVRDWRDAVGERLVHAAEGEGWGTREQEHLMDCHPVLPRPPAPAPPVVRRARRRAVALLASAAAVLVAVLAVLALPASQDGGGNVVSVSTTAGAPSTTATTTPVNRAPDVGAISATFEFPVTTYTVAATDADGDDLTYAWVKEGDRDCGDFTTGGPVARWSHPHPPCPEEAFHPSVVRVTVTDGEGHRVTAVYERGSEPGTGEPPA